MSADQPPTILQVFDTGAVGVLISCCRQGCNHRHAYPIDEAGVTFGPDATFPQIAARARCSKCGGKDIDARPRWPTWRPKN